MTFSVQQMLMKRYSEEEILRYAERRVKNSRESRGRLGRVTLYFWGALVFIGMPFCCVWMLVSGPAYQRYPLLADERFYAGAAFGILCMLSFGVGGLGFIMAFRKTHGIEGQAIEMLVKMAKEREEE